MIDKKKVLKQTEEAAQRSGRFRYLKKNATTNLRILEYKDSDGATVFAQALVEHRRQGQGGRGLGICRQEMLGKPCAYCAANAIAAAQGQMPFTTRTRYVVNAVDLDNEPGTVRLWVIPTSVFSDIADYACDDEWTDVLEPKGGYGFAIKRTGVELETSYTVKIHRKPYPVGKNIVDQVTNPLEGIRDPGLAAQCAELDLNVEDLFDADELEKLEEGSGKPTKAGSKAEIKKTSKKVTKRDESEFNVGQAVKYEDEEEICHITEIDGDEITIEDASGVEYKATADQLTVAEEPAAEEKSLKVGDRVEAEIDGGTYAGKISKIKDEVATVKFDDGDVLEIPVEELAEEGGVPFEGDAKAPKCFGDPNLFDETDNECKKCSFFDECGGNTALNKAGVGNNRTPARQPAGKGVKKAADDVIAAIMGS